MEAVLFYSFSTVSVLSAICVIAAPRPTRALLSLIVTMFSLAVLFLLLGAYFVAMVHLIVYAGAVLVLFLFVIMLQGVGASDTPLSKRFPAIHLIITAFMILIFLAALLTIIRNSAPSVVHQVKGSVEAVGMLLFNQYLLPFELTSLLILVAVFAAVALAKKEEK